MSREEPSTVYSDESPFVRLFKSAGRVRILNVFINKPYVELSPSEVSELAGIDNSTFHRNINELLEIGVVENFDNGRYQINMESEIAEGLVAWNTTLQNRAREIVEKTDPTIDEIGQVTANRVPRRRSELSVPEDVRQTAKFDQDDTSDFRIRGELE